MSNQLIFVVDDDEFIQRLLKDTLENEGYRVTILASAEECYRKLGSEVPNLFVLDIMLPGQDGFQLCRNLRKQALTERVPILMLSSKAKVQDRVIGLEAGADDYLVKPFHLDELTARIRALFRRMGEIQPDQSKPLSRPFKEVPKTPSSDKKSGYSEPISQPVSPKPQKQVEKPPAMHSTTTTKSPPVPSIDLNADFDTRKKFATELYQQRLYDKALQMFENLAAENSKDLYVKKYLEVTRTSMMKHYLTVLGSKDAVPVRTSDRPEDFIGLDFNTQEGFIFSRIDGVTDCKGIVSISGMKPISAYGILYNLFNSGVIKMKK